MEKITSQTFNAFFDKKLIGQKETVADEREFVERFGSVDLLLSEYLNPSKSQILQHVYTDENPWEDLDEETDLIIEQMLPNSGKLGSRKAQSLPSPIPTSNKKIQVGTIIAGRYEVEEYIGEGAFGVVYRGYHNLLKIDIAIKALKKSSVNKHQAAKRFIREAQIMANINHPNVIRIYDAGEFNGQVYLIMKYIAGQNLEQLIDRKVSRTISESIELMIQISEALTVIHSQEIIHRDIKPSNIMIDSEGKPILMDFGIAKAEDIKDIDHKNLTVEGNLIGTPNYMAPEQFKTPNMITKATDTYALGVTFYQMITGIQPFSGESFLEVYEKHKTFNPPMHTLAKNSSPRLSKVISKMLQKDPSKRYSDGAAVKEALQQASTDRSRGMVKLAAIITVLALIVFLVVRSNRVANEEKIKAQLHIANSLITEGNGLILAREWNKAKSKFSEALGMYLELKRPTIVAEFGLWEINRNSPPILNSCTGHTDPPLCMAISPDGKLGISGSSDGELIGWDLLTGKMLRTFKDSKDSVPKTSVAFSSDAKHALSSNFNGQIILWNVDTGKQIRSFNDHGGWVHKVVFSPDNTKALSADENGSLILWEVATGEKLRTYRFHKSSVRCIAFSSDGKMILSGSSDKSIAFWDINNTEPLKTFNEHKDEVTSVTFSHDSRSFISGSNEGTIKVWDRESGKITRTFNGSESAVLATMFLPDDTSVLVGQNDSTVTRWDLKYERPISTLLGNRNTANNLAFSTTGEVLLSATETNRLNIQSTTIQREVISFVGHTHSVRSVDLSNDGIMAVSGGWDGKIILWDCITGYPLRTLEGHKRAVKGVAFTPDNTKVVSASLDGTAALWSLHSGKAIRTFFCDSGPIEAIDISPDGNLILAGYRNGDVVIWDQKKETPLQKLENFGSAINSVAFSRNGNLALAGSNQGKLILVETSSFETLQEFNIEALITAKFSPNNQLILCGCTNGNFKVLDVETGHELQTFKNQSGEINAIEWSPDGLYVISGSQESPIKVWELKNGQELFTLKGHREGVKCLKYSQSSRKLISGSKDKTVKLWDFSRLSQYSKFEASLGMAHERLKSQPHDPESLMLLGEWYVFRGLWNWGIELLNQARKQGISVSGLTLARCYWHMGNLNLAYEEFHRSLGTGEAPDSYLQLCMTAVEEERKRENR